MHKRLQSFEETEIANVSKGFYRPYRKPAQKGWSGISSEEVKTTEPITFTKSLLRIETREDAGCKTEISDGSLKVPSMMCCDCEEEEMDAGKNFRNNEQKAQVLF